MELEQHGWKMMITGKYRAGPRWVTVHGVPPLDFSYYCQQQKGGVEGFMFYVLCCFLCNFPWLIMANSQFGTTIWVMFCVLYYILTLLIEANYLLGTTICNAYLVWEVMTQTNKIQNYICLVTLTDVCLLFGMSDSIPTQSFSLFYCINCHVSFLITI